MYNLTPYFHVCFCSNTHLMLTFFHTHSHVPFRYSFFSHPSSDNHSLFSHLFPCMINPWRAWAARVTLVGSVSQSVCQSVCCRFNSLLNGLFVPQTIPPTQRITRISLMEGFFLKRPCCRDTASTASVWLTTVSHFVCRK